MYRGSMPHAVSEVFFATTVHTALAQHKQRIYGHDLRQTSGVLTQDVFNETAGPHAFLDGFLVVRINTQAGRVSATW